MSLQRYLVWAIGVALAAVGFAQAGPTTAAAGSSIEMRVVGVEGKPVVLPGKPYEVNFVMFPAAQLRGQLQDAAGQPVAGRQTWITGKELPPSSSVVGVMETDRDGRFRFDELPTRYTWRLEIGKVVAGEVRASRAEVREITLRVK